MNDRIKTLCQEAFTEAHESRIGPDGLVRSDGNPYIFYEKFAELIAAECISVVTNLSPNYPLRYKNNLLIEIHHRDQLEEVFREDCVKEIKQHFGVEE